LSSLAHSDAGEREGAGFSFPALFGTGDIGEERAKVVVDDAEVEESGRSFLGTFTGRDYVEIEISERGDRRFWRWLFLLHV
jgi:hypothetical protein